MHCFILPCNYFITFSYYQGVKQIAMPKSLREKLSEEVNDPTNETVKAIQDYVIPTLDQASANFSLGLSTVLKVCMTEF